MGGDLTFHPGIETDAIGLVRGVLRIETDHMSTITAPTPGSLGARASRRRLSAPEQPGGALAQIGPNWFASVMGTGILATAALLLPVRVAGQTAFAIGAWALAAVLLAVLAAATAVQWVRYPAIARSHHRNPAMAPFYGAPAMAVLTVGAGTLLVGSKLIGVGAAVTVDELLWTIGTVIGLACTIAIPYFMFTGPAVRLEQVNGGWLMAIVPPMVSAATGAALIAHVPAGQARLTLALACYGMFGISLIASLIVFGLLVARLARHGAGPARLVPTLWIGLGPLGQSITAVGLLSKAARPALPASFGPAIHGLVFVYGLPVWGFAIVWLTIAATITIRTARRGLPFAMTWWSFTFPVGTLVTGTSELSEALGAHVLTWAAVALFGLLLANWLSVASRTARGVWRGSFRRSRRDRTRGSRATAATAEWDRTAWRSLRRRQARAVVDGRPAGPWRSGTRRAFPRRVGPIAAARMWRGRRTPASSRPAARP
jgi:C4-dicarboxylate transporter/malic acid transport protein